MIYHIRTVRTLILEMKTSLAKTQPVEDHWKFTASASMRKVTNYSYLLLSTLKPYTVRMLGTK